MSRQGSNKVRHDITIDRELDDFMRGQFENVPMSHVIEHALVAMRVFLEGNQWHYPHAFGHNAALMFFSIFINHQESCYKGDSKMIGRNNINEGLKKH